MSQLVYNGINLAKEFIKTYSIVQEPVYSNDGVDYLFTHFVVNVRAVLNLATAPTVAGETSITQTAARIRSCLLTPHRALTFTVAGDTFLSSPQGQPINGISIDANNGPKPLYATVTQISGSQTYYIEFSIETWLNECAQCSQRSNGITTNPNSYLSNRWEETQSFNELFYVRRQVKGRLVVRSDAISAPQNFKDLIYAAIPPGFERQSAEYTVVSNGTALDYSFVDQEVYRVAPWPASKWKGEMIVGTTNSSASFYSEAIITMFGGPEASKQDMIARAAFIGMARLAISPRTRIIMQGSVREMLHENTIELRMKVLNCTLDMTWLGFVNQANYNWDQICGVDTGILFKTLPPNLPVNIGAAPNYTNANNPAAGYQAGDSVNSPINYLAKFIDDPCLGARIALGQIAGTTDDTENEPTQNPPPIITIVNQLPLEPTSFDPTETAPNNGAYTDYRLDTSYVMDYHTIQIPLASSTSNASTAFATLAKPTMRKVVKWTAENIGDQPTMPNPLPVDTNEIILGSTIMPSAPRMAPDGVTQMWRISGEYVYAVVEADYAVYAAGQVPFLDQTILNTDLDIANFETSILNPSGGEKIDFTGD